MNVGQGVLLFPDVVTIGTTTTLDSSPVVLNGSYPLGVQNAVLTASDITNFGYTSGGLNGSFASLASAPTGVVIPLVSGIGMSAGNYVVKNVNDGLLGNRPGSTVSTFAQGAATLAGFLEVSTAVTYTFRSGSDDGFTLYIDGNPVYIDPVFGHGLTDVAAISIPLSAGFRLYRLQGDEQRQWR